MVIRGISQGKLDKIQALRDRQARCTRQAGGSHKARISSKVCDSAQPNLCTVDSRIFENVGFGFKSRRVSSRREVLRDE